MATVKNDSQGRIETVTLHRNEVLAIYDALDRGMSQWENDRDGDTTDDADDDAKYDMATLVWRVLESVVAHPA